jgi:hypothetical protein
VSNYCTTFDCSHWTIIPNHVAECSSSNT